MVTMSRRSDQWFRSGDMYGFLRRAYAKSMGFDDEDLSHPIIGIAQTWSELNNCNNHLDEIAQSIKRGVWQAGGTPLEFPTISLGEVFIRPTSMLYRNLMAMDTEEMVRSQPLDGVVLLGNCDKTVPAQLMGAASADIPAMIFTGGPTLSGRYQGKSLGACSDCRHFWAEFCAGELTAEELHEVEESINRSSGHCTVMGTASTMACVSEVLGLSLLGTAAIPAPDSRRLRAAESAGREIVQTAVNDIRPSAILGPRAFENALRILMALGGSTNAVVHLIAIAGRSGVDLRLESFDEFSRSTPYLVNVRPSGEFHMEQFYEAGGVPAVLKELGHAGLLHLDAPTVTGRTLGEMLEEWDEKVVGGVPKQGSLGREDVIRPVGKPIHAEGGLAVLKGNLAPRGSVVKQSAVSNHLRRHGGRAVVFASVEDLKERIDDPELDVTADSVLVLQEAGPRGAPGMPEVGSLPIPGKLLRRGVRDMVRISDARMSGTAYGTVILHVAPESAVGGPLGLVYDGDWIEIDVDKRSIHLAVEDEELERRRGLAKTRSVPARGYYRLYTEHVLQADEGCDFDFLVSDPEDKEANYTV